MCGRFDSRVGLVPCPSAFPLELDYNIGMTVEEHLEEARRYFERAHKSIKQTRKYTGEPYFNHCSRVAAIVEIYKPSRLDLQVVAFGHDVIEDVFPKNGEYSYEAIVINFGDFIGDRILDLTEVYTKERYPSLNRAQRKQRELQRIRDIHVDSKFVKLADLIDNTDDITRNDPKFAVTYLKEKAALLSVLKGEEDDKEHQQLWELAYDQIQENLRLVK